MSGMRDGDEISPEEIVAQALAGIHRALSNGTPPRQVLLSRRHYLAVQRYHQKLGALENAASDYITRGTLFGLPIVIDDQRELEVVATPVDDRTASEPPANREQSAD